MPRKILAFLSVVVFFVLIIIVTQFAPTILKIKKVECQIDEQACSPELVEQLELIQEKSFLFSPLKTHVHSLDLNLYQLDSVSKSWPNTVILKFSHKPNSYLIKLFQQDTLLLVSENGLTQSISTEQNLPLIEIYDWINPIQENHIAADLHRLNLDLIQLLAAQNISYHNIKIYNSNQIEILLQKDLTALAQKDELEKQIVKLSIILSELDLNTIDLQINKIDLRFKFPVLKSS